MSEDSARRPVSEPVGDPARIELPIVLIGPMGAGKSKVGRRLAQEVGAPFVDTDEVIVERYGPIDEIFAREGEEYFRVIEREVVAEAIGEQSVVSLGGGAVLHPDTRAELAQLPVVWLQVSAEAVAPRLASSVRPLIAEGGIDAWVRIRDERRPIYETLADLSIDTSRRSVARIIDDITEWFGGRA